MTPSTSPSDARSAALPAEEFATCNGMNLCYQQFGPADGEPLLFIMGLGAQMVFWPDALMHDLAARGYHVIRFDNRDIGRSERLRCDSKQSALVSMLRYLARLKVDAGYTLYDMVDDTIALLDHLGIAQAHLIGASMGGMIAQLTTATHPERVKSLTSIMSNTNSPWLPPSKPSAILALIGPKKIAKTEDEYLSMGRELLTKIGGNLPQGTLLDDMLKASFARGIYPRGVKQQFMAILATGDFTSKLKTIRCPTTIIHGAVDPLLRPAGGRASARAITGARLELIDGMGHDLPPAVLPRMVELIDATAKRVR